MIARTASLCSGSWPGCAGGILAWQLILVRPQACKAPPSSITLCGWRHHLPGLCSADLKQWLGATRGVPQLASPEKGRVWELLALAMMGITAEYPWEGSTTGTSAPRVLTLLTVTGRLCFPFAVPFLGKAQVNVSIPTGYHGTVTLPDLEERE